MPQEKISFLRKVYSIISFQLLLTVVVVFIVTIVPAVANFFNNIQDDIIGITFFASFSLCYYHENHPFDYFLLLIFTVSTSLSLGLFCALVAGALASDKSQPNQNSTSPMSQESSLSHQYTESIPQFEALSNKLLTSLNKILQTN
ncbi:F-box protein SKIP2 [Trifolium repens]|nr:F-box protein SKIP2 [Trifolium repens]